MHELNLIAYLFAFYLQEIGDFENWMKTLEFDCRSVNMAFRNIQQGRIEGQQSSQHSSTTTSIHRV